MASNEFMEELVPEGALEHYGIPRRSGRFPWGSGENPYHHGASSPFGRKRLTKPEEKSKRLTFKEKRKIKAVNKQRQDSLEKARKAKSEKAEANKAAAEYEAKKQQALKSGSASDIAPYIKDCTREELLAARLRLEEQAKMNELYIKENPTTAMKVDKAMKRIETATGYVETGLKSYNVLAKLHNSTSSGKAWPIIESGKKKK